MSILPLDAPQGSGLLVPVLPTDEGPPDAVAILAWHLALSNLIAVEVPHDLLALWLFPAGGGTLLLAPEELAQDRLAVPAPTPFLHQHDLFQLEERIRKAGYASAIAIPVRGPHRDLGLVLFAALQSKAYGIPQALRLHVVVRDLTPTFEALVVAPPYVPLEGAHPEVTERNLLEMVARAGAEAKSGPELLRLLSGALRSVLPHERLEVAFPGLGAGRWALLSGVPAGARWREGSDQAGDAMEALIQAAEPEPDGTFLVQDLRASGLVWPTYRTKTGQRVRSVLGVPLRVADPPVAWLLVGGAAPHVFRPADRSVAVRLAPILAVRVQGLRQALVAEVGQAQLHALQSAQPRTARLLGLLAEVAHWGEASRRFEREVCDALGYGAVRFALRLGEDRIVVLKPGELRPLTELPSEPLDLAPIAPLMRGSATFLVYGDRGENLAVPLRLAGRVSGALELVDGGPAGAGHAVTAAQQFADLVAPHLELLRRAALPLRGTRPGDPSPLSPRSSWLKSE